jgi:hypothetical protein
MEMILIYAHFLRNTTRQSEKAVMYYGRRPYLLLLSPSGKSGQLCARAFPLKKTWKVSLSIGVRITMIRCVVYLLLIFKTFNELMNNPVLFHQFPLPIHSPVIDAVNS